MLGFVLVCYLFLLLDTGDSDKGQGVAVRDALPD